MACATDRRYGRGARRLDRTAHYRPLSGSGDMTDEQREKAKAILVDLQRGHIYMDCAIDRLAALLKPPVDDKAILYKYMQDSI